MAYYCIIRMLKPEQIIEVGSGFSTLVAEEAILKNGFGKIVLIEPFPMQFLKSLSTVDRIVEKFVQDIPITKLVDLIEQGNIWFIDSTHTVKHGSDCLYMYLKAMPEIKKEMMIHSHDIFLPFSFSEIQLIDKNITWTEQHLLYAYLLDNPHAQVVFSSTYSHW
ncbi:MAG: class I SAM-dependent methyltransferase [Synechococcales cyanobacterium RM1_1_8]|nr:class I SAM-dependent methyltransferase [Synechococcales cyanobacterium RM1_1_8]